jgi:uncharacterized protein YpmB
MTSPKLPLRRGSFLLLPFIIQNVKRNLEVAMIICIIFFVILLSILLFASAVENLFTADELASMGVSLTYTQDGLKVT